MENRKAKRDDSALGELDALVHKAFDAIADAADVDREPAADQAGQTPERPEVEDDRVQKVDFNKASRDPPAGVAHRPRKSATASVTGAGRWLRGGSA